MDKILILSRIEDIYNEKDQLSGKHCFDSTGYSVKVKGGDKGKKLWERFDELQIGRAYSFEMGEFGSQKLPYVKDFKSVEKQLAEKLESEKPPTPHIIAPQELGLWWKELGECIRSGQIVEDFPNAHTKIKAQYYKRMFEVTEVKDK